MQHKGAGEVDSDTPAGSKGGELVPQCAVLTAAGSRRYAFVVGPDGMLAAIPVEEQKTNESDPAERSRIPGG
jgi:hypothetical protein